MTRLRQPNRLLLIARREFRERVGLRAFKVSLLLGALVTAAAVAGPALLRDDGDEGPSATVAVIATGADAAVQTRLLRENARSPSGSTLRTRVTRDEQTLRALVRDGEAELGLVLTGSAPEPQVTVVVREDGGGVTLGEALSALQRSTVQARAQAESDLSPEAAASLLRAPEPRVVTVQGSGPNAESAAVAFVLVLLLYVAILLLVQSAVTGLVSDRNARVTERLLAAARPHDHLFGKLLGVGASGVMQLGTWFAAGLAADVLVSGAGAASTLSAVPPTLLICFPFALLGGYVLYAALSTLLILPVEKPEDVAGAISPGTTILIVGVVLATTLIVPGATVSPTLEWLSLVPFFAPILMLARVAGGDVALWEVIVGMAGPFVLGALLLAWFAPAYARNAVDPPSAKGIRGALALLRR